MYHRGGGGEQYRIREKKSHRNKYTNVHWVLVSQVWLKEIITGVSIPGMGMVAITADNIIGNVHVRDVF